MISYLAILALTLFSWAAFSQEEDLIELPPNASENARAYRACLDRVVKLNCYEKYASHVDPDPELSRSEDKVTLNACMAAREVPSADAAKCYKSAFKTSSSNPAIQTQDGADNQAKANPAATPKATPTPTPQPRATNPPAATSTDNSATDAQAQVDREIQSCTNLQSTATRCCGNPMSCSNSLSSSDRQSLTQLMQAQNGPAAGQSMTEYCAQMQRTGNNSASLNNGLATICASNQSSCSSTCNGLYNKYLQLATNNHGKAAESVYLSAADQVGAAAETCDALQSRANQLATQGLATNNTNNYSTACQQMASANPQSPGSNSGNSGSNNLASGASLAALDCKANPNSSECLKSQANGGASQFEEVAKNMGDFGVPDAPMGSSSYAGGGPSQATAGAKVQSVPNNSGGGFGGDGGATRAQPGGSSSRPSPGSPGYTTDIMQGERGGGGYSPSNSGSGSGFDDGRSNYDYARQRQQRADDGGMLGMDLRKYLPGGSRDPNRQLAGMARHSEINAKEENIWHRISNKMIEKCKLGVLWRCQ